MKALFDVPFWFVPRRVVPSPFRLSRLKNSEI
jgi:hypothetical protein